MQDAPTGTIGLVMDCDTTGIEPDFALGKFGRNRRWRRVLQDHQPGRYLPLRRRSFPGYAPWQVAGHRAVQPRAATPDRQLPAHQPAVLRAKGFTEDVLKKVEVQLPGTFELPFVFNLWTLGEDFVKNTLKVSTDSTTNSLAFDLLTHLGFTKLQIAEANQYVCGTMTIEGAPHLKSRTPTRCSTSANKCGKTGKRFLSWFRTSA